MTTLLNKQRIAYWLLPARNDALILKESIQELSARHHTPLFEPHLTLLALPVDLAGDPTDCIRQLAARTSCLNLICSGPPVTSEQYNQALFLPLQPTPALTALVSALHPLNQAPENYHPHISLLYGSLDQLTGDRLLREVSIPHQNLRFDRISAVSIGPKTDSHADVRQWKVISTEKLRLKES